MQKKIVSQRRENDKDVRKNTFKKSRDDQINQKLFVLIAIYMASWQGKTEKAQVNNIGNEKVHNRAEIKNEFLTH